MKKKVVKLNESHLTNIIKKVIRENTEERELNLRNNPSATFALSLRIDILTTKSV